MGARTARLPAGRRRRLCVPVLGAAGLLLGGVGEVAAQEYHVDQEAPRRVVFVSSTTLDEFEGVTDAIDGYVVLDGGGVRATREPGPNEIYFEVDLASMDTGIALRNRHMRENYLEVEDHPWATFSGRIDRIEPGERGAFRVYARGEFAVHGVTRERALPCQATPAGEAFDVECIFPVLLEDHDIEIPSVMFMKLAPEVRLQLRFTLTPAGTGTPLPPAFPPTESP